MPSKFHMPGTKPENGRETENARKWRIFWSYLPDWCLTIFLWGMFYLLDKIDGYRRMFSVTDTSISYPSVDPERIKVWHLGLYAGLIPAVIIICVGTFVRRSPWDVHAGLLGFLLNLGLTITFTNITKITAGRPRPDLLDRCQLPPDLVANPVHGLVDWRVCTKTDTLREGFRSFPSGHSSFAWAGFWYLILYGAAKMRISNRRGYTWKSWLLLAPLSGASLVSISRTMDYRHHATDVIAGAIIGILAAWFAYRQFYPALGHPQAYKPYSPRIPRDDDIPLHHTSGSSHTTHMTRPSTDAPHASLLPAPGAASMASAQHNGLAQNYPHASSFPDGKAYTGSTEFSKVPMGGDRVHHAATGRDRAGDETVQREI